MCVCVGGGGGGRVLTVLVLGYRILSGVSVCYLFPLLVLVKYQFVQTAPFFLIWHVFVLCSSSRCLVGSVW